MAVYWEIGFDFESVVTRWSDQVPGSSSGQKTILSAITGKVLVFDEGTKKIVRALEQISGKKWARVETTARRIAISSYLICWQIKTMFIFRRISKFGSWSDSSRRLPPPSDDNQATLRDYQEIGVKMVLHAKSLWFCGILADDMELGKTLQTISFWPVSQKKETKIWF